MARAAHDELDGAVGVLHQLGGLLGTPAVLLGGHVSDLPGAVHLVAEAPELHAVGLGRAGLGAHVRVAGARGRVAVFHPVAGLFRRSRAEVHAEHRLPAHASRQRHELVGADPIRLHAVPGELAQPRSRLGRADPVLPVVAGDEVPARVAHHGHVEPAQGLEDVRAPASVVRVRAAGLVDPLVDRAAHVLEKAPEDPGVDLRDLEARVEPKRRRLHVQPSTSVYFRTSEMPSTPTRPIPSARAALEPGRPLS